MVSASGLTAGSDHFGHTRLSELAAQLDATLREAPTGAIPPRLFTSSRHSLMLGRDGQPIGSHQPPLVTHTFHATPNGMQSSYTGEPPASLPSQEIVDLSAGSSYATRGGLPPYGTYIPGSGAGAGAAGMDGDRPPRVSATASHDSSALTGAGAAEAVIDSASESRGAGSTTRGSHTSSDAASSTSNSAPVAEKGCFKALIDCIAEVATKIWNAVKDFFMFLFCCNTTPATKEQVSAEVEAFISAYQKIDSYPALFTSSEQFENTKTELEALETQLENIKNMLEGNEIIDTDFKANTMRFINHFNTQNLPAFKGELEEQKKEFLKPITQRDVELTVRYLMAQLTYMNDQQQPTWTLSSGETNLRHNAIEFNTIKFRLQQTVQTAQRLLARIKLTNNNVPAESQVATNQIDSITQAIARFEELITEVEQHNTNALAAEQAADEAWDDVDGDGGDYM